MTLREVGEACLAFFVLFAVLGLLSCAAWWSMHGGDL